MTVRNRQKGRRERVGRKGGREGKRVVQRKQAEFMHVCNFQIKIIKKTKGIREYIRYKEYNYAICCNMTY